MSWWPWTSVARLCDAKETIAWQRIQIEGLTDAKERLQRFQSGMSETPRAPRRELLPMPDELKDYLKGIGTPFIQKDIRDRAYKRHGRGEPWDSIMNGPEGIMPPEEEEEEE